ncbi:MAG: S53 family peptidase [Armatimonadetes bacterium]|nr:S53 family peptidase [Armatimonadota bacterium]
MHTLHKMAFGSAALAAIFALSGCGGSGSMSGDVAGSQAVSNKGPVASATIQADGVMGLNGDSSIFVPSTTSLRLEGFAHTNHLIKLGGSGVNPAAFNGYAPADIRAAYGVPSSGGSGTIVIVDAYNDPYALADFNYFSAQYGLPQETSTSVTASTNKVFQVVYASGRRPSNNSGWSQEADLDIEWAHAMAPSAKIVLVEASSASTTALYNADNVAATIAGVHQCSNSWGGGEYSTEASSDGTFNHTGVVYFFSSGDTGGAQQYPSASVNVVAVGGTSLTMSGGVRTNETAWNGAGCGPSAYEPRPSFQSGISGIVGSHRGIADVSAVADPNTGVLVRWNGGWYIFGGTSVACPIIAGITNMAGTNRSGGPAQNAQFYANLGSANFYDVTSGTAGSYSAAVGWDWPTGVGSPNGLGGF